MVKNKLAFCTLSTALFISLFNQSVSASGDIDDLSNKISSESSHVEIVKAEEVPEGVSSINFDSYEDFENAVRAWEVDQLNREKEEGSLFSLGIVPSASPSFYAKAAASKSGTDRIKWSSAEELRWVYSLWLPQTMYIDFEYTYIGSGSTKKFSKITSVKSNSNGFPSSWHQTTSAKNISANKRSVSIKIQGYHLLGVNISGQSVGAKFSDSYNKKYSF